jgi:hypothetical protein
MYVYILIYIYICMYIYIYIYIFICMYIGVSFVGYSSAGLPTGKSIVVFPKVQVYFGGCLPFAVEGGTTVNFNLALTVIHSGSVGVSPGINQFFN